VAERAAKTIDFAVKALAKARDQYKKLCTGHSENTVEATVGCLSTQNHKFYI